MAQFLNKPLANKQRGISLFGMLFVVVMMVLCAVTAIRIVPVYTEFMTVKKVLKAMQQDSLDSMTAAQIRAAFDKHASIDYISVVNSRDITISRSESGATLVSVDYQVVKPLVGNVSLLMDFSASSDGS